MLNAVGLAFFTLSPHPFDLLKSLFLLIEHVLCVPSDEVGAELSGRRVLYVFLTVCLHILT